VPGVEVQVTGSPPFVAADLRVLTGVGPDDLRPATTCCCPAPASEPEARRVADWDRAHPLLRFVDLRETVVGLGPRAGRVGTERPRGAPVVQRRRRLEAEGWTVLARPADLRPVLAWRERAGVRVVRVRRPPSQTDLVFRPAFPTLVANLLDVFRGGDARAAGRARRRRRARHRARARARRRARGDRQPARRTAVAASRAGSPTIVGDGGAPVRVERPTPLAWALVAVAALALLIEWWAGPGVRVRPRGHRHPHQVVGDQGEQRRAAHAVRGQRHLEHRLGQVARMSIGVRRTVKRTSMR
jgi:hypothetical protein